MNARQIYALFLVDQTIRNIHFFRDNVHGVDLIDSCYCDDGTLEYDHLEEQFLGARGR
jgi:hypothetical protein